MESISKNFNIPEDRVYKTIHKYGNTSASSVAIALDELSQSSQVNDGDHLLLVAFGAGLTWGATVLTKIKSESNG
jgi:3-oxoacyl-[acyl-carrier-protein] synthase-3